MPLVDLCFGRFVFEFDKIRMKSSARGPRFKVSSDGLSTEIEVLIRSPIQEVTEADVV